MPSRLAEELLDGVDAVLSFAEAVAGFGLRRVEGRVRLQRQFEGKLNAETIERFMNDSLDQLVARANTGMWIPLLAERFARDRLRALVRLESDLTTLNPSVLFLCVHNAGRSQMAAGWMRHLAGESIDVFSGGSEPAENVNQAAVAAMAEVGVDIEQVRPLSDMNALAERVFSDGERAALAQVPEDRKAEAFFASARPAGAQVRALVTRHPSNDFKRQFMADGSHFVATADRVDWWGL